MVQAWVETFYSYPQDML